MGAGRPRRTTAWLLGAVLLIGVLGACAGDSGSTTLRVSGSTTVNPVAADAAVALRKQGLTVLVDTQGGSAGGIAQLGSREIDVAMSSKPVENEERRRFPGTDFFATTIGGDAVAVMVRREVFDAGVRNLTKSQLSALVEGRVRNWTELGGPDLPVFVYDKEPGRGTREVLDRYLYGGGGTVPPPPDSPNVAIVGGNEETLAKLLSTPGSTGPLSAAFLAGNPKLAAVALDGVELTTENVKSGAYPLARPLFLVTDGLPKGVAKRFVDYVLSPPGQALVRKHGYLSLADLAQL